VSFVIGAAWSLAALLHGSAGHTAVPTQREACIDVPRGPTAVIGPRDAALRVEAFLDPSATSAHASWVELRRVVGEGEGRVRVDVRLVRPGGAFDPRADRVRRFAVAAARLGQLEAALRLVAREGHERLDVRLRQASERSRLAEGLDVPAGKLGEALGDPCVPALLDAATSRAHEAWRKAALGTIRLPAYVLGDRVFDDGATLTSLRPELAREPMRRARALHATPTPAPEAKPRAARLRVPPRGGVRLGGVGLPHRMVLMADTEDDEALALTLPRLLAFRSEHPGIVSVQILARGHSLGATELRHRLCAARLRDRELDYARVLAIPPALRREPSPAIAELLAELDEVPESECEAEPDPATRGLPGGIWLDGLPRSLGELEDVGALVRLTEAWDRPLSLIWAPAPASE
jgi:hypothetical protein